MTDGSPVDPIRVETALMEEFALLMLLGVRVREVKNLVEGNIWLPRRRLLLIDEAMASSDRAALAANLTVNAAEEL